MILDDLLEFCDAAVVTGSAAATTVAGDVIDLGSVSRDIGNGEPLYLVIQVDTLVAATGGAANLTLALASDSVATLDSSPTTHWTSGAIAKGTLVAGYQVCCIPLPQGTYERYLGILKTPDTNDITSGKINAFITSNPVGNPAYPDAL